MLKCLKAMDKIYNIWLQLRGSVYEKMLEFQQYNHEKKMKKV